MCVCTSKSFQIHFSTKRKKYNCRRESERAGTDFRAQQNRVPHRAGFVLNILQGGADWCLSVSEICSCQGKGRKLSYHGNGRWFVQTDKAWTEQPGSGQGCQHLRCDPSQQLCCISSPDWTIPPSATAQLHSCAFPALCHPRAATATVLCHGRDNVTGTHSTASLLGGGSNSSSLRGAVWALFCKSQRCLK